MLLIQHSIEARCRESNDRKSTSRNGHRGNPLEQNEAERIKNGTVAAYYGCAWAKRAMQLRIQWAPSQGQPLSPLAVNILADFGSPLPAPHASDLLDIP